MQAIIPVQYGKNQRGAGKWFDLFLDLQQLSMAKDSVVLEGKNIRRREYCYGTP